MIGDRSTLSVVVLTRNEEKHIRDCLASVKELAAEMLVLDSGSTDQTEKLARQAGARVEQRAFDNYPCQRNAAIDLSRGDWVFFIDADERATPAATREIGSCIIDCPPSVAGFWIPRRNIIFGREIRHTGWSPDYQPRLLRKGRARFDPARQVHELVLWDGETRYLREPLMHHNYDSLALFREKQVKYARYEAQVWYAEGKRARRRGFVGQPLREFFRRFASLQGWRDGGHGLLLSLLMSYYAFVRQRMLWEMSSQNRAVRLVTEEKEQTLSDGARRPRP